MTAQEQGILALFLFLSAIAFLPVLVLAFRIWWKWLMESITCDLDRIRWR